MQTCLAHRYTRVLLGHVSQAWSAPCCCPDSPIHYILSDSSRPSVRAGSPEDIRWLQSVRLVEPFDNSPPEPGFWENVVVSLQLLLPPFCRSALPETDLAGLSPMRSAVLRAGLLNRCILTNSSVQEYVLETLHSPAVALHPALVTTSIVKPGFPFCHSVS